jgi:hypothetical protein
MKNVFDFVIKGDECAIRGKKKTLKQIKDDIAELEAKYD